MGRKAQEGREVLLLLLLCVSEGVRRREALRLFRSVKNMCEIGSFAKNVHA